jgi:4-amino-4-deoxy-L-arabinose transferase-like glycosyltransferase
VNVEERPKKLGTRWVRRVLLLALALVAFLPRLGARDIVTSHEARVAQTARQMAASGWPWHAKWVAVAPTKLAVENKITFLQPQWTQPPVYVNPWLIPVMSGQIRLQKPPLPYWCAAALYRITGVPFSERLTRLIPAILGALATLVLFSFVRLVMGRTAAWCAALIWVSTYFISEQYRLAMADPYLGFFTLACMWMWARASIAERGTRNAHGLEYQTVAPGSGMWASIPWRRVIPLKLFYVFLALGILAKGPVIFLPLVIGIICFQLFLGRPWPKSLLGHAVGIIALIVLVSPWVIYVMRHVPNAMEIWRYESVGEFADNEEKSRPLWFYLPNLFVITLPWTPVWIAGIVLGALRWRRISKFIIVWYAATIFCFSASHVKKDTYLLPIMPAQVMLTASGLAAVIATVRRYPRKAILAWIQVGIGIGGAVAAITLAVQLRSQGAIALAALCLASACGAFAELRVQKGRLWMWRQTIAYALAILVILDFFNATRDNRRSARPVCNEVTALMQQTGETLAPGRIPEEAALYLPLDLPWQRNAASMLTIVDDPKNLKRPVPAEFADRVPWRRITTIQQVALKGEPDKRWRVYRLLLQPIDRNSAQQ